ncbi:ABC transporter family substrate-binding protein [Pseudonocardia acaciae]|uniref:ABC transporter family substrate-binding protein n=1 Tax=Pseudonocardia acaciae TaxID=551276 RepID=UPI00055F5D79|nr:ABC transporter family substrate-binding protein [Pseudonocardia acaciae]
MITRRGALVLAGVAALGLAGCGGAARTQLPGGAAGHSDINPRPRDQVRDGGDLRWPIDVMPDNFNFNQFSGTQGQTLEIVEALLPAPFRGTEDGGLELNTDYLTSAVLTSTSPQVVTYTINPRATWSDGTPLTWRDFEAQWKALRGADPAFQVAGTTGYEDMASVARGADDRQAVVTYARPFAEWRNDFRPLYPASTNSDPSVFNTGWVNKIPVTAGPFTVASIDLAAKTVTLERNPRWWGAPAKLDRIIFKVVERAALADGLANNEIDFYRIGSNVDLFRRAQSTPGAAVRQSPGRRYNHITFNGSPGAILSDVRLRQAIAKGIDRAAITRRLIGQIAPNMTPAGNHVYAYGSKDYRDNSDILPYDQAAANRELDALGWARQGAGRARNGQPLRLRLVESTPNPISEQIDRTVLDQLAQIGVTVTIEPVPLNQMAAAYRQGNFDLAGFAWENTSTPFSSSRGIYTAPTESGAINQNYGRIYNPEISALFDQGIRELDDTKRAEIGNRADRLIWQEVHHLPLYPDSGAYAVRSTLANFGAPGFADIDYINAGFAK